MQLIKYNDSSHYEITATESVCPACGKKYLKRIPRRVLDRMFSQIIPVQRYQCLHNSCQWVGNFRVLNNIVIAKN